LSQLVRDSMSAPAADDLMQGELGLQFPLHSRGEA
jgi:hypothetical protein